MIYGTLGHYTIFFCPPILEPEGSQLVTKLDALRARSLSSVLWIAQTPQVSINSDQLRFLFACDAESALETLRQHTIEAVLIQLPVASYRVEDLLARIRQQSPQLPIVIFDPEAQAGDNPAASCDVFQHIDQPVPFDSICHTLLQAINQRTRPSRNESRRLVGSSAVFRDIVEIIGLVSSRRCTVLITGETGTGKEVAARALHEASNRSGRLVAVNCAALPDHLLEAELFGHTKGAFTGAVNARVGLFEQANRGTILLDEIGEMPLPLQAKLLRVLQEREIQRIGSSTTIPVDVRVIAASNTNLLEAMTHGRFRKDLYYRLNVVSLRMPALRERAGDIPELSHHFLQKIADLEYSELKTLSPAALETLMNYSWPGNVRQLEHALESAVALSGDRMILEPKDFDLPAEVASGLGSLAAALDVPESGMNFEETINEIERRLLERALLKSGGNKARAADMLQMKRTTLISKFKALEAFA